jgi:hypothetical protein
MNLPTILIGLTIAVLLVFAVRYIVKNGMCAVCEVKGACSLKKSNSKIPTGCSGSCAGCRGCPYASNKTN